MRAKKYIFTALCLILFCRGAAGIAAAVELQTHKNSIGMEFVLIPAGSFMMGEDSHVEETPQRRVTISKPFYLGKYEVTRAQWEAVMGGTVYQNSGWRDHPVGQVSWNEAQEFIRRLNQKEGHSRYRLPTEAEWELAARGGTDTRYFFGDSESALEQYAWFEGNSGGTTHPVGQKKPNQYGLYDIYGNVWEWCQDLYSYRGAVSDYERVVRGGSWRNSAEHCRSNDRDRNSPDGRGDDLGFRLALSPE